MPVVTSIEDDSPAAKCGLKAGDVITAVDGKPVCRSADFERDLLGRDSAHDVPVTIRRNNESMDVKLALAEINKKSVAKDAALGYVGF